LRSKVNPPPVLVAFKVGENEDSGTLPPTGARKEVYAREGEKNDETFPIGSPPIPLVRNQLDRMQKTCRGAEVRVCGVV
jgi:hypothetical protein